MATYDFLSDFELGKKYEEKFAVYLESMGGEVIRSQEYKEGEVPEEGYDLKEGIYTYEIKRDRWMERTGNICVEMYSSLRCMDDGSLYTTNGWFHTTTASYLVVFFNEFEFIQMDMDHLQEVWFDNPRIWTRKEIRQKSGYSTINWLAPCTPENFPKMTMGDIRK